MGFFDRFFRKKHSNEEKTSTEQLNTFNEDESFIEEVKLEKVEEEQEEEENAEYKYLKVIRLYGLSDVTLIQNELEQGNVVIADVSPLKNSEGTVSIELKRAVDQLRGIIRTIDGDIALLGDKFIITTPAHMKIWRREP